VVIEETIDEHQHEGEKRALSIEAKKEIKQLMSQKLTPAQILNMLRVFFCLLQG
jgi:hypothetical protein